MNQAPFFIFQLFLGSLNSLPQNSDPYTNVMSLMSCIITMKGYNLHALSSTRPGTEHEYNSIRFE